MDIIPVADLGVKASWGLFAGVSSGPWGGYLSFRSNFVTTNCAYSIDSSGNILDGGKFWGNGSDRYGKWSLTGGAI